jgi:regulator of ribonuclease activity A
MFRDLKTRLCLHLEIFSERCIDVCGDYAHRMRRPILFLSAVAIILTIRAARESINTTKATGYLNDPYDHQRGMYSPHAGAFPAQGQVRERGGSSWFNWGSSSKQDNSNNFGYSSTGGYNTGMGYDGILGGGIQSSMSSSSSSTAFSTAQLCDSHCRSKSVHVSSNVATSNILKNYGGKSSFSGEIVTVTSHHNMDRVKAMLSDPGTSRTSGASKVLVVDGGHGKGSAAAILDSTVAQMAKANGWAGVILYGCVRQVSSLSSVQIGILATCTNPKKGDGFHLLKGSGRKASHVSFAGLKFNNGGFVYVDEDGILVSDHGPLSSTSSFGPSGYGSSPYESTNLRGASTYSSTYGASSSTYGDTSSLSSGYGSGSSSETSYGGTSGTLSYGSSGITSPYGSAGGASTISSSYGTGGIGGTSDGIGGIGSSSYGSDASTLYGGTTRHSGYDSASSGGFGSTTSSLETGSASSSTSSSGYGSSSLYGG